MTQTILVIVLVILRDTFGSTVVYGQSIGSLRVERKLKPVSLENHFDSHNMYDEYDESDYYDYWNGLDAPLVVLWEDKCIRGGLLTA